MTMKRVVLTFGLISGAVSSALMLATLPFMHRIGFDKGLIVGYTAIVASFLPIFFGIRAYRDQSGGTLTFGRGFAIGLLITLMSSACYVVTWEIIYFKFWPDFANEWTAHAIEQARKSGAGAEALEQTRRQMSELKAALDNPLTNAAYTFVEPFPVGLLVSLISAGVLRRRPVKP
jgi:Protein of unknown function (DUF4199)